MKSAILRNLPRSRKTNRIIPLTKHVHGGRADVGGEDNDWRHGKQGSQREMSSDAVFSLGLDGKRGFLISWP